MTHMSNYALDRLSIYTFKELFQFIKKWTHLDMMTDSPIILAQFYFELFPEERNPLWEVIMRSE